MLKVLNRIVAFLLVPCLIADPSFAVGIPLTSASTFAQTAFNQQALIAPVRAAFHVPRDTFAAWLAHLTPQLQPAEGGWLRDLRNLEGKPNRFFEAGGWDAYQPHRALTERLKSVFFSENSSSSGSSGRNNLSSADGIPTENERAAQIRMDVPSNTTRPPKLQPGGSPWVDKALLFFARVTFVFSGILVVIGFFGWLLIFKDRSPPATFMDYVMFSLTYAGGLYGIGALMRGVRRYTPFQRFRRAAAEILNNEIERAEALRTAYGIYSPLIRTAEGYRAIFNIVRDANAQLTEGQFYHFFNDLIPQVQRFIHTPADLQTYGEFLVPMFKSFQDSDVSLGTVLKYGAPADEEIGSPDDLINQGLLEENLRRALTQEYGTPYEVKSTEDALSGLWAPGYWVDPTKDERARIQKALEGLPNALAQFEVSRQSSKVRIDPRSLTAA